MENLVLAKLTSREFIIGRLVGNIITNPFQVNFTADPEDGTLYPVLKTLFSPISFTIALTISLDKTITFIECPTDLANKYVEVIQKSVSTNQEKTAQNDIEESNDKS